MKARIDELGRKRAGLGNARDPEAWQAGELPCCPAGRRLLYSSGIMKLITVAYHLPMTLTSHQGLIESSY